MFRYDDIDSRSRGPVTCTACGCRLQPSTGAHDGEYRHFGGYEGRDARGCTVACVGLVHDTTGRPVEVSVAA